MAVIPAAAAGASLLSTIAPSLITAGASLLGGLFGGAQKSKERAQSFEDWKKQQETQFNYWKKMRNERISSLMQSPLKPDLPYYGIEQGLPAIDYLLRKAVLGQMGDYFGGDKMQQYGIDINDIIGSWGMNKPFSETPWANYGQQEATIPETNFQPQPIGTGKIKIGGEDNFRRNGVEDILSRRGLARSY